MVQRMLDNLGYEVGGLDGQLGVQTVVQTKLTEGRLALEAQRIVAGPNFAHGITKTMLHQEWNMSVDQAIEAEAQAQAICMQTRDFERAYQAFVNKQTPEFLGD